MFQRITKRDRPEVIERLTQLYAERMSSALQLARKRASRSSMTVRKLLASASVVGRAQSADVKAAVVSFKAPPFSGGLHHFYPWSLIDRLSHVELATDISQMLRSRLALREREGN